MPFVKIGNKITSLDNLSYRCAECKINNSAKTIVTVSRMDGGVKKPYMLCKMCMDCAENYLERRGGICAYSDCTKKATLATRHVEEDYLNIDLFCSKQCKKLVATTYKNQNIQKPTTMCKVCLKTGKDVKRCGRCQRVYYCSRECQKSDWSEHKVDCLKN